MIMAAVSAGTSELKGSLGSLQDELRAQRAELDRRKSFLGFRHIDNIGGDDGDARGAGGGGACGGGL